MRPIVTYRVAWSVGLSVGLSVALSQYSELCETTQPIEMPFGLRIQVGQMNHVLDGDSDPHGKGHFRGRRGEACCKVQRASGLWVHWARYRPAAADTWLKQFDSALSVTKNNGCRLLTCMTRTRTIQLVTSRHNSDNTWTILLTRSTGTVHTSARARLTSVAIRIRIRIHNPDGHQKLIRTNSSAIAEGPRDALGQLKSCQLLHNCTKNHIWLEGLPFHVV